MPFIIAMSFFTVSSSRLGCLKSGEYAQIIKCAILANAATIDTIIAAFQ